MILISPSGLENYDSAIDELLRDVLLFEKRHSIASHLSGGEKRKLCVAIALIGSS